METMDKDPYFSSNISFNEDEILEALGAYRKVAKCAPDNVAYVFHLALTERDISVKNCHSVAQRLHNKERKRSHRLRSRVKDKQGKNVYRGAYYAVSEETLDYLSTKDLGNYRNGKLLPKVERTPHPDSPELSESDRTCLEIQRLKKNENVNYYKKIGALYTLYKNKSEIAQEYGTHAQNVTPEFMKTRNIIKL